MRDLVLARSGKLGHRDALASRLEHRVVTETAITARRGQDPARALAARSLDAAVGPGQRGDAHEARRTRVALASSQLVQQPRNATRIVEAGPP